MGIKYLGCFDDNSGYGEANRNYLLALNQVGIELTTEIFNYSSNKTNLFGEGCRLAHEKMGKNIPYDIKIIHVPSDAYLRFLEPCKYHIGHLFWETDRMSPEWVWNCNLMDEIWTGSEHNKRAFVESGVKVPVWVFPQAVGVSFAEQETVPWKIKGFDGFLFYSVFQWITRKNPTGLVTAFLKEFKKDENIALLLKTYETEFTKAELREILSFIRDIKTNFPDGGKIFVNVEKMTKNDVWRVHKTGDCFVLPHRGEGWSLGIAEALLFKKPIIATNCGGIHDWLTKETYYPLPYKEINVFGMEWAPWYRTNQKWADVDIDVLAKKMRYVYEHQDEAKETGEMGYGFAIRNFSYEAVGRMLKDRIIDIQKMIDGDKKEGRGSWL